MFSLSCLHLYPFVPHVRVWCLFSLGLFVVKTFFLVLSNHTDPIPLFLIGFVWKSQVPFKVKSFAWLVAHKKINTNDMPQMRKSYKAHNPDVCLLRMDNDEMVDHFFLHCLLTLGL